MMLDGLGPYPTMQDSGVPWLGEVPEHWMVRRIKTLFREKGERSNDGTGLLLSLTRARGLLPQSEASNRLAGADDLSKYKVCRPSDLVMNRMQAWSGMFAVSPLEGLISPDYSVFEAIEPCEVKHFEHLFKTPGAVDQFVQASKGIGSGFNRLYTPDFGAVPIVVPPLSEQAAIVHFLDHADRRIRRYIRAKQQLIALLEEQKQAHLHQAVTGQIDVRTGRPFPAYKPSGVEWLGDVPEHWEIARLGRLIELLTGFPFKSEGFTQDADDIRLLRGVNIAPGKVRWNDIVRWPIRDRPSYLSFELHAGDIVLGMDRPIIQSGVRVATIEESDLPSLLLQRVACIRPEGRLRADFLILLLAGKSFSAYLTPIFTGISVPHLSPEQIRLFRFALPAVMEQEKIVEWTVASTKTVESAVKRTHREIALLGEYRTRLIADVVTGKLDVREAATRLPDEVEELEPLDEADALIDGEEEPTDALATAP